MAGTIMLTAELQERDRKSPRDTAVINTGVRLAAGGAGRLLRCCCSAVLLGVRWGMCGLAGHGHALHLLQVGAVLRRRGLRAPITMMRTHVCPMAVLQLGQDYLL